MAPVVKKAIENKSRSHLRKRNTKGKGLRVPASQSRPPWALMRLFMDTDYTITTTKNRKVTVIASGEATAVKAYRKLVAEGKFVPQEDEKIQTIGSSFR